MNQAKIIIAGAGQAAAGVARGLRTHGYEGSITIVGEECHPPYERPPLSKDFLSGSANAVDLYFLSPDWWAENRVKLMLNCRVEAIDRVQKTVTLSNGGQLDYGLLVIATGGRPRLLACDAAPNDVVYVRNLDDAQDLAARLSSAKSLCVVGGGFLGLEVASSARKVGRNVTILEAGDRLLPRVLPPEISDWLQGLHVSHGVNIECRAVIESVVRLEAGRYEVKLDSERRIQADCLVACIGMEPNTRLAVDAGIVVSNGIVTDSHCRTSDPCIYAIGDVASRIDIRSGRQVRTESWQNAEHQAAVAAASIAGTAIPAAPVPWFWTDQLGRNIQIAGAPDEWDELVWRGDPEQGPFAVFLLRGGKLVGGISVDLGREMTPLRQLIQLGARPDPLQLSRPDYSLRSLVAQARSAESIA